MNIYDIKIQVTFDFGHTPLIFSRIMGLFKDVFGSYFCASFCALVTLPRRRRQLQFSFSNHLTLFLNHLRYCFETWNTCSLSWPPSFDKRRLLYQGFWQNYGPFSTQAKVKFFRYRLTLFLNCLGYCFETWNTCSLS